MKCNLKTGVAEQQGRERFASWPMPHLTCCHLQTLSLSSITTCPQGLWFVSSVAALTKKKKNNLKYKKKCCSRTLENSQNGVWQVRWCLRQERLLAKRLRGRQLWASQTRSPSGLLALRLAKEGQDGTRGILVPWFVPTRACAVSYVVERWGQLS